RSLPPRPPLRLRPPPRRASQIPQNPYHGSNPPPAPKHVPTPDWTPWKPDLKDPSIPTYTIAPLP
ncbi:hypothetical protein ACWDA9_39805, partial [Streptomyces sp. NPDC001193]